MNREAFSKQAYYYEAGRSIRKRCTGLFGGSFLVRGGHTEVIEGRWKPGRMVVLEFPTMDHAKQWWDSEQYSKAKAIRQRSAKTNMIFVEGI